METEVILASLLERFERTPEKLRCSVKMNQEKSDGDFAIETIFLVEFGVG